MESGVTCGIVVSGTNVRTGETVSITFVVSNGTQKAVLLPVPDYGTLTFHSGDGTALAANPGRPDKWTILDPGKSLIYSLQYEWKKSRTYEAYFEYGSRFDDKPFEKVKTRKVSVFVTK